MTQSARKVLAEALVLDAADRTQVIDELYDSLQTTAAPRSTAAWAAEAESRVAAFHAGRLPADTAEVVLVSSDLELLSAARDEGLPTVTPRRTLDDAGRPLP